MTKEKVKEGEGGEGGLDKKYNDKKKKRPRKQNRNGMERQREQCSRGGKEGRGRGKRVLRARD